jgi:hypothetical protein
MRRSAHSQKRECLVYFRAVAYEDEPYLTKPAHVSDDVWRARYGDYVAALALYKRVIGTLADEAREGRTPTDDQLRAEDVARDLVTIARDALLDLCHSLRGPDPDG